MRLSVFWTSYVSGLRFGVAWASSLAGFAGSRYGSASPRRSLRLDPDAARVCSTSLGRRLWLDWAGSRCSVASSRVVRGATASRQKVRLGVATGGPNRIQVVSESSLDRLGIVCDVKDELIVQKNCLEHRFDEMVLKKRC